MGLRIPQPQPQDLASPVPGPDQGQTLGDVSPDESFGASEEEMSATFSEPGPVPAQEPAPQRSPADLSDEEMNAFVNGLDLENESISPEELQKEFGGNVDTKTKEAVTKTIAEGGFWDRFASSMGRNIKEKSSFLENKYGSNNVKIKDDKDGNPAIFWRRKTDENFRPFDSDSFTMADLADFGGELVEGVTSAVIETAAVAGVVAAAPTTAGVSLAGIGGAMVAGAAVGGAIGTQTRRAMLETVGGDSDPATDEMNEMLWAGGLNTVFLGLGSVASKFGKNLREMIDVASPKRTIEKVATMNLVVDKMARQHAIPLSAEKIGVKSWGVLKDAHEQLGRKLSMFKEEAKEVVGNKSFIPESYMDKTIELLKNQRVHIDPSTGKASITKETLEMGSPDGKAALKEIADRWNINIDKITSKGGLDLDEMLDESSRLGGFAERFAEAKDLKVAREFEILSGSMAGEKNKIISKALEGTEFAGESDAAMKLYSETIKDYTIFRKLWRKNEENGELFVNSLVRKGNNSRIESFKKLVGSDSKDWKTFQASYINRVMENSTGTTTGIFDAKKFIDNFSDEKLGKEVRSQFFNDVDFRKLRSVAREFEKSPISEITNNPGTQNKFLNMIILAAPFPFPYAKARAAWQLTKGDAKAADFLLDRGFVKLAEEAANPKDRKTWLRAATEFRKMIGQANRVTVFGKGLKVGNGEREIFKTTAALRNYFANTMADGSSRAGVNYDNEAQTLEEMKKQDPAMREFLEGE